MPRVRWLWLLLAITGGEGLLRAAHGEEWAALRDVAFADSAHGWAVGDRGRILATSDGGRSWREQASGVTATLHSLAVLDAAHVWAAGGDIVPRTHGSRGVLLRTEDGGQTWLPADAALLPLVRRLEFADARRGTALTQPSALYPSGLLRTTDGGEAWAALPLSTAGPWRCGSGGATGRGVLADAAGRLALWTAEGAAPLRDAASPRGRALRCVRLGPTGLGCAVGDRGTVLLTRDGGRTWHPAEGLPAAAAEVDFAAAAIVDDALWLAGAPGSLVLHSPDAGRAWELRATGCAPPLHALTFVDAQRGLVVGALGTILATEDGGRTWIRRRGAERASLLVLARDPEASPLALVARLSGEGRACVVEALHMRPEPAPAVETPSPEDRLAAAVAAAGGEAWLANGFPLPPSGLALPAGEIVAEWDQEHGGQALAALQAALVRRLRQWRPDVVVYAPGAIAGEETLAELLRRAIVEAAPDAADPELWPAQGTTAGLAPWSTTRVVEVVAEARPGDFVVSTADLPAGAGATAAEIALRAEALLVSRPEAAPSRVALRRLHGPPGRSDDLFAGLPRPPRSEPAAGAADAEALRAFVVRRRLAAQLLERTAASPDGGAALLGQLDDLTSGLSGDDAGELLFAWAQARAEAGRPDLAREGYLLFLERQPNHPLADAAWTELVRGLASRELTHRFRELAAAAPAADPSAAVAEAVERRRPDLFASPTVRLPLAAAARARGDRREAERLYRALAAQRAGEALAEVCARELWLLAPAGPPPDGLARAVPTAVRPRLDGVLDDACWREAPPLRLAGADAAADCPGEVRLACDREFLYLAAACRRAAGQSYPPLAGPRVRDPDLADSDRIEILLDVDRDYATHWRLTLNHRGETGEACWDDAGWNPTWYVAAAGTAEAWSVEAAVPWRELADAPPSPRDAWAVAVRRVIPAAGVQSWRPPAGGVRPESYGTLRFE